MYAKYRYHVIIIWKMKMYKAINDQHLTITTKGYTNLHNFIALVPTDWTDSSHDFVEAQRLNSDVIKFQYGNILNLDINLSHFEMFSCSVWC